MLLFLCKLLSILLLERSHILRQEMMRNYSSIVLIVEFDLCLLRGNPRRYRRVAVKKYVF